jgi:trigger factor
MDPNQFAQMLDSSGQVNMIVGEVRRRKALAAVLGKAAVKDSKGDVVDLTDFVSVASEEGPAGEDEAIEPTAVTDPGEVRL